MKITFTSSPPSLTEIVGSRVPYPCARHDPSTTVALSNFPPRSTFTSSPSRRLNFEAASPAVSSVHDTPVATTNANQSCHTSGLPTSGAKPAAPRQPGVSVPQTCVARVASFSAQLRAAASAAAAAAWATVFSSASGVSACENRNQSTNATGFALTLFPLLRWAFGLLLNPLLPPRWGSLAPPHRVKSARCKDQDTFWTGRLAALLRRGLQRRT